MDNALMVFEGNEVEVFELNGKILFNPRHVAPCLDMTDSTLRDHLGTMNSKQVIKLTNSTVGLTDFRKLHNTGENFLTESGVYRLIFKSRKPSAEKFQDWVTDEVLPSIRKTGSYSVKDKGQPQAPKPPTKAQIARELRGGYSIARFFKMEGNAALLSANQMVVAEYAEFDINPLRDCGALLSAPDKIQYFTPTTLGAKVGVSAQKFNTALEAAGLQIKELGPKKKALWSVTSLGKEHCDVINTGKKHTNGAPITQILWAESAIEFCTTLPGVGPALPEPETTTPLSLKKQKPNNL